MYALDENERHRLRVDPGTDMRLLCAFSPDLVANEVHDHDGMCPPSPGMQETTET
jgi:L-ectoine synthase